MAEIRVRDPYSTTSEKKRTRVQLSCTACRSRKLKCCRTHPCTNCTKRGEAHSCAFVGRGPRGRNSSGRTSPSQIQDRLQHLENLILSLAQKKKLKETKSIETSMLRPAQDTSMPDGSQVILDTPSSNSSWETKASSIDVSSKLVVKDAGTSYIDGAHWSAILEEINGVKEYLQGGDEISDEESEDSEALDPTSPTLLFGLSKTASIEELLADIPPRPVCDRLISQFLKSKEPLIVVYHIPTFQKEYNQFWLNPQDISLPWLGLLYAVLTLAVAVHQRLQEPLPSPLEDASEIINTFRKRNAQCLAQSNYIQPGKYKVEALFSYVMGEFYRSNDAQVSVSFLLGTTIRLAMRMGYHRDPQHFSSIPPFEGEMRRRVWSIMRQLDSLISFQVGLPRTIQDWQHDTEMPRNLFDEDLYEGMQQLPPSRPDSELTTTSYTRVKSRLMSVFGKISDLAYSREPVTYEETLETDRRLEEAHNEVTPIFKIRPIEQSIADPAELILGRYTLELLYQKARCVLHRRYLGEVHTNLRYAYSRWACMSASKEILRQQVDLHHETQPGGILYRDRQFPNSLQYTDYLLAAMIICLELSHNQTTGTEVEHPNNEVAVVINGREDLLAALEVSHSIFEKSRQQSADAQKAYNALTVMLRRVKRGLQSLSPQLQPRPQEIANEPTLGTVYAQPPPYGSWQGYQNPSYALHMSADPIPSTMDLELPVTSLDVIEDMLNAPTNLDWGLWDQQIQGLEGRGMCFLNNPEEANPGTENV